MCVWVHLIYMCVCACGEVVAPYVAVYTRRQPSARHNWPGQRARVIKESSCDWSVMKWPVGNAPHLSLQTAGSLMRRRRPARAYFCTLTLVEFRLTRVVRMWVVTYIFYFLLKFVFVSVSDECRCACFCFRAVLDNCNNSPQEINSPLDT